ncbi:hypothetical protein A0H81_10779 [Grifola frondosa]|uniref:Uncharacterized protein n=1 Tax=Grifola frondosa TaxID=5627 RepID=A0A1C7M2E5_GRIFR|nr:hypothetical protein A0H81_10779 [Grifola frondosa]
MRRCLLTAGSRKAAITGTSAGLYALLKGHNHAAPFVASAALNGAIHTRFTNRTPTGFREYIVSPVLLSALSTTRYSQRIRELHAMREAGVQQLTWWDLRMYKTPDTGISGALTGGVLNAWKRGRAGIVPGATTAGLLCTILQLAYNELGIMRVKYVTKVMQKPEQSLDDFSPHSSVGHPISSSTPPKKPLGERILTSLGFKQISDEEYLQMIKRKRDGLLRKIAELETEVEVERAKESSSEVSSTDSTV